MSLATLFVRDFAIVHRLDLELNTGLTVLTGETGAGKSILVDALALALGARAETDSIRDGADSAEVLASFELSPGEDATHWLREQELTDGQTCITRRLVYRDKPSKAYINGRPVTILVLKELGNLLVDIHGQHEHQSLLRRGSQRQVLDDYADIQPQVEELGQLYENLRSLRSRHRALSRESDDQLARMDLLRYQINELEKLELGDGEYRDLEQEHSSLAHASDLTEGMQYAAHALYDGEDTTVNRTLAQCIQKLDALSEYSNDVGEVSTLLSEALVYVEEAASQLHHKLDRVELDPERLAWVERRIGIMVDLARKHKCDPDRLNETLASLSAELSDIDNMDTSAEELEQQIQQIQRHYHNLAQKVSFARSKAARRLSSAVTEQMQGLGMRGGQFDVSIATMETEPTRFGYDHIEFQVRSNKAQPPKPLTKVASGGELSRISLAIQVVTASVGRVPSLIFDEVDVGIGGGIAEIVGQKLRALSRSRQVLCITHLPQVASQGCEHLQIRKQEDKGVRINVTRLDARSRVDEIARMLGGIKVTEQTRANAEDMLERASG